VHAISPGPLATRQPRDSGIRRIARQTKAKAPARCLVSIEDVGVATAFLPTTAARLITGERFTWTAGITSSTRRSMSMKLAVMDWSLLMDSSFAGLLTRSMKGRWQKQSSLR